MRAHPEHSIALPRLDRRHHHGADDDHRHDHRHSHVEQGHSHGLVDATITRSRAGVKAVAFSLAVLAATAAAQTVIYVVSGSVALLADLIHNFGDALTALPLAAAFVLRSRTAERLAGYFVVLAILVSACVALYETIVRLIHPEELSHLWALAAAGFVGYVGMRPPPPSACKPDGGSTAPP